MTDSLPSYRICGSDGLLGAVVCIGKTDTIGFVKHQFQDMLGLTYDIDLFKFNVENDSLELILALDDSVASALLLNEAVLTIKEKNGM